LFNRAFLGISILWFAYIVVLMPIQQKQRAEARFAEAVGECTHDEQGKPRPDSPVVQSCMVQAEGLYVIRNTSAKAMYGQQGWSSLMIAGVGFPLVAHGLIVAFSALVRRLRGSGSNPRSPRRVV